MWYKTGLRLWVDKSGSNRFFGKNQRVRKSLAGAERGISLVGAAQENIISTA
jgi:hypothetical protein